MAAADLTAARVRELVHYEPESGAFTWLPRPRSAFRSNRLFGQWHGRCSGKMAGGPGGSGYIVIPIDDGRYQAHRLAWLYVHGEWPEHFIDHINGIRSDNRLANLRDVSRQTNQQNMRKAPGAKQMPLGVYFHHRKLLRRYSASIRIDGRTKHLGYFDDPEVAHDAYLQAKRRHHAGCTI